MTLGARRPVRLIVLVSSARPRISDWICGPELPTPVDEKREPDREPL